MGKGINRLHPKSPATLPPGIHADGGGLYLRVKPTGGRSWVFVYQWRGKRSETGLGSLLAVKLTEARTKAGEYRELVKRGIDPKARTPEEPAQSETFGQAAEGLMDSLESGWKNEVHRAQWRSTLETYCAPIWDKDVAAVDTADVLAILSPIWLEKQETARRVRGRIERVLDAAKVRGQRSGDNPALWRGHLSLLLPRHKKSAVKHHPAMPYSEAPQFMKELRPRLSMAARALQFLILTAARSGEVLGARWREFDMEARVWTVPAERMKMGVEHRVPLTEAAMKILRGMELFGSEPVAFVFPSQVEGKPLTNMIFSMLLRRMKRDDVTAHGFRSTFRDWVAEQTDHPREVAETALAHAVGDEVERAYRRTTFFDKRRLLMEDWATYVTGEMQRTPAPANDAAPAEEPPEAKRRGSQKALDAEAEALQTKLEL